MFRATRSIRLFGGRLVLSYYKDRTGWWNCAIQFGPKVPPLENEEA